MERKTQKSTPLVPTFFKFFNFFVIGLYLYGLKKLKVGGLNANFFKKYLSAYIYKDRKWQKLTVYVPIFSKNFFKPSLIRTEKRKNQPPKCHVF